MPAVLLLVSDGDHDTRGLAALDDCNHLVRLRSPEVRVEELVAAIFGGFQNRCASESGSRPSSEIERRSRVEHPGLPDTDRAIGIEKTNHSFRLLKWLNQSVQKQAVEAAIAES